MTIPYMMNCSHSGEGWCIACVKELGEECEGHLAEIRRLTEREARAEILRDEADCERLKRRENERWLNSIKESLRPFWTDHASNWDGSLVGLPSATAWVAERFGELEIENIRLTAELDDLRSVVIQPWVRDGDGALLFKVNLSWWETAVSEAEARALVNEAIERTKAVRNKAETHK